MDDLNSLPLLVHAIVDASRRMQDRANASRLHGCYADVWKRFQQLDVISESVAEPGRGITVLSGDVLIDLKKIFPRLWGNNYLEHRLASSLRNSSSGIPSPAFSCTMPASIAASVWASSSSVNSGTGWSKVRAGMDNLSLAYFSWGLPRPIPQFSPNAKLSTMRDETGKVSEVFGLRAVQGIYKAEGIALDYRAMKPKIRAVYMCDDDSPSVAINKKLPTEPKLFSLVHELKHHYKDRSIIEAGDIKCGDYNRSHEVEIGAEVFAAEFIYPEAEILAYAGTLNFSPMNVTAEQIVHFKRGCKARVSFTFIRKALARLGFIPHGAFLKTQFTKLEEQLYGVPIHKQEWFKAYRARRSAA